VYTSNQVADKILEIDHTFFRFLSFFLLCTVIPETYLFMIQEVAELFYEQNVLEVEPEILPDISWRLSSSVGRFVACLGQMFFQSRFTCCTC
jgi:hypothetical protein